MRYLTQTLHFILIGMLMCVASAASMTDPPSPSSSLSAQAADALPIFGQICTIAGRGWSCGVPTSMAEFGYVNRSIVKTDSELMGMGCASQSYGLYACLPGGSMAQAFGATVLVVMTSYVTTGTPASSSDFVSGLMFLVFKAAP